MILRWGAPVMTPAGHFATVYDARDLAAVVVLVSDIRYRDVAGRFVYEHLTFPAAELRPWPMPRREPEQLQLELGAA